MPFRLSISKSYATAPERGKRGVSRVLCLLQLTRDVSSCPICGDLRLALCREPRYVPLSSATSDNNVALPPTAAVLTVTVCSLAKRGT